MWFYRYVIRGLGLVLIVGLVTVLVLTVYSQLDQSRVDPGGQAQKNQQSHTPSTEGRRPK